MEHELKCWKGYFQAVIEGRKTFEVREDTHRGFQTDDQLKLYEFKIGGMKTGRWALLDVTYVFSGIGMEKNFVCMGIKMIECCLEGVEDEM